ncbi:uncharacterized protein LOC115218265, partial [Argonauta hians]
SRVSVSQTICLSVCQSVSLLVSTTAGFTTGPLDGSKPPQYVTAAAGFLVTGSDVEHGDEEYLDNRDRFPPGYVTPTDDQKDDDKLELILFIVLPVCLAVVAFIVVAILVRCLRKRKAVKQARRRVVPDLWIHHSQELPLYALQCPLAEHTTDQLVHPKADFSTICEVLQTYIPQSPKELHLQKGEFLKVVEKDSNGWCRGVMGTDIGWFPGSFVTEIRTASLIEVSEEETEKETPTLQRLKPRVSSFMIKKRVSKDIPDSYDPNNPISTSHSELADTISLPRSRTSTAGSSSVGDSDHPRFQHRSPSILLDIPARLYNAHSEQRLSIGSLSHGRDNNNNNNTNNNTSNNNHNSNSNNNQQRRMSSRRIEPPSLLLQIPSQSRALTPLPRPTRPAPPPPPSRKPVQSVSPSPSSPSPVTDTTPISPPVTPIILQKPVIAPIGAITTTTTTAASAVLTTKPTTPTTTIMTTIPQTAETSSTTTTTTAAATTMPSTIMLSAPKTAAKPTKATTPTIMSKTPQFITTTTTAAPVVATTTTMQNVIPSPTIPQTAAATTTQTTAAAVTTTTAATTTSKAAPTIPTIPSIAALIGIESNKIATTSPITTTGKAIKTTIMIPPPSPTLPPPPSPPPPSPPPPPPPDSLLETDLAPGLPNQSDLVNLISAPLIEPPEHLLVPSKVIKDRNTTGMTLPSGLLGNGTINQTDVLTEPLIQPSTQCLPLSQSDSQKNQRAPDTCET